MSITRIEADFSNTSHSIGIIVAKWNSFITDRLLEGAVDTLVSKGYSEDQLVVVACPGAYEIPLSAQKLLPKVDGIIALGAVIRGETPHFDYVCAAVNNGISELNMKSGKPVSFGVLTTDTVKQARERAGGEEEQGNKGSEAALALLEMFSICHKIEHL